MICCDRERYSQFKLFTRLCVVQFPGNKQELLQDCLTRSEVLQWFTFFLSNINTFSLNSDSQPQPAILQKSLSKLGIKQYPGYKLLDQQNESWVTGCESLICSLFLCSASVSLPLSHSLTSSSWNWRSGIQSARNKHTQTSVIQWCRLSQETCRSDRTNWVYQCIIFNHSSSEESSGKCVLCPVQKKQTCS